MSFESQFRCFNISNEKFNDEKYKTLTSKDQINTETLVQRCFERFEQLSCLDPSLPKLHKTEHFRYLENSLRKLSSSYECLDSSRPWLVYWILNATYLLNLHYSDNVLDDVITFLTKCRSPYGGFGGGPGQYPHLATTYAAVNSLCIIGTTKSFDAIDRKTLKDFLHMVREETGAYRMHVNGELDVRGAYCAISVAKLANFTEQEEHELFEGTAEWIISCQTYEGGFGGTPDLEAHGGYSFCAISALSLLGKAHLCDLNSLLRWTVNRQMRYEGGFQGRTNKLVDGCYSFWQASIIPIAQAMISKTEVDQSAFMKTSLFNREALQEYVLFCCQKPNGGLVDKPGKIADLYHTCYTLSGLSIAQHCEMNQDPVVVGDPDNELLPTHPLHNIPPKSILKSYEYFQSHNDSTAKNLEHDNEMSFIEEC